MRNSIINRDTNMMCRSANEINNCIDEMRTIYSSLGKIVDMVTDKIMDESGKRALKSISEELSGIRGQMEDMQRLENAIFKSAEILKEKEVVDHEVSADIAYLYEFSGWVSNTLYALEEELFYGKDIISRTKFKLDSALDRAVREHEEAKHEYENAKREHDEAVLALGKAEIHLDNMQTECQHAENAYKNAVQECDEACSACNELQKVCSDLEAQLNKAKQDLSNAQVAMQAAQQAVAAASSAMSSANTEEEKSEASARLSQAQSQLSQAETRVRAAQARVDNLTLQLKAKKEEFQAWQGKYTEAKSEEKKCEENLNLAKGRLAYAKKEYDQAVAKEQMTSNNLSVAENKLNQAKDRLNCVQQAVQDYLNYCEGYQRIQNALYREYMDYIRRSRVFFEEYIDMLERAYDVIFHELT